MPKTPNWREMKLTAVRPYPDRLRDALMDLQSLQHAYQALVVPYGEVFVVVMKMAEALEEHSDPHAFHRAHLFRTDLIQRRRREMRAWKAAAELPELTPTASDEQLLAAVQLHLDALIGKILVCQENTRWLSEHLDDGLGLPESSWITTPGLDRLPRLIQMAHHHVQPRTY